ncbi:hypothetical protein D3C83_51720 [compost metagenome]
MGDRRGAGFELKNISVSGKWAAIVQGEGRAGRWLIQVDLPPQPGAFLAEIRNGHAKPPRDFLLQ